MWASAVGVGIFAIFMTVFLLLDPALMEAILQNSQMTEYLNPYSVSLFILAEGLMASMIASYALTRMAGFAVEKT